jgi:KUP system potassium uptake protein
VRFNNDPNHALRRSALLVGIIYSDIGTSPLYTVNGMWPASGPAPPQEDVIGGISAILWALTLLPLFKYASL